MSKNRFLIILFASFFITSAFAQNIYVGNNGMDQSGYGYSISQPFKTLGYAAGFATPGDTIFIKKGTYKNATFRDGQYWKDEKTVSISNLEGTKNNYIVIMPYDNKRVVFKGDGEMIFQIRDSRYVKIQGLEIIGEVNKISLSLAKQYQFAYKKSYTGSIKWREQPGTPASVVAGKTYPDISNQTVIRPSYFSTKGFLVQSSDHIEVVGNKVHHAPGTGLRFQSCDYIICTDNEVHNNSRRSAIGTHGLVFHSSKSIDTNNSKKIFIERNIVRDNYNEVYSWSSLKTFITPKIDEGKGISMQKNYAANGWKNGRMLIANNITYRNGFSGVHTNKCERINMVNNVSYLNSRSGHGNNIGISASDSDDIKMFNNIVVADDSWGGFSYSVANTTNFVFKNNAYKGAGLDPDLPSDPNLIHITTQLLFTNAGGRDFSLVSGSPVIDAGNVSAAPADDFFENQRDASPDMGAVEYISTSGNRAINTSFQSETTKPFKALNVFPNPVFNQLFVETEASEILIFNQTGKLNRRIENSGDSFQKTAINVSDLPAGFYFVRAGEVVRKVVKQ